MSAAPLSVVSGGARGSLGDAERTYYRRVENLLDGEGDQDETGQVFLK